jgi:hypothetical protein
MKKNKLNQYVSVPKLEYNALMLCLAPHHGGTVSVFHPWLVGGGGKG